MEKEQLIPLEPKGLGIITASIFLAGEMAGSGVLALPAAIVGTGWSGLLLILFFSANAAYIGSRLGLCWEVLAESGFEELQCQSHVRDPYPLIAEKAGSIKGPLMGRAFRLIASGKEKNTFNERAFLLAALLTHKRYREQRAASLHEHL